MSFEMFESKQATETTSFPGEVTTSNALVGLLTLAKKLAFSLSKLSNGIRFELL